MLLKIIVKIPVLLLDRTYNTRATPKIFCRSLIEWQIPIEIFFHSTIWQKVSGIYYSPQKTERLLVRAALYRGCFRIQITLVLVFIFSRYWSKSIIRAPPGAPENNLLLFARDTRAPTQIINDIWD